MFDWKLCIAAHFLYGWPGCCCAFASVKPCHCVSDSPRPIWSGLLSRGSGVFRSGKRKTVSVAKTKRWLRARRRRSSFSVRHRVGMHTVIMVLLGALFKMALSPWLEFVASAVRCWCCRLCELHFLVSLLPSLRRFQCYCCWPRCLPSAIWLFSSVVAYACQTTCFPRHACKLS